MRNSSASPQWIVVAVLSLGCALGWLPCGDCQAGERWQGFGYASPSPTPTATAAPGARPVRTVGFDYPTDNGAVAPAAATVSTPPAFGFGYASAQPTPAAAPAATSGGPAASSGGGFARAGWPMPVAGEEDRGTPQEHVPGFGYAQPSRPVLAVDASTPRRPGAEPRFGKAQQVPFEEFAYGEYLGPHRTPHVPEYRLRVNDQLEFVYTRTREKTLHSYRLYVGDTIEVSSAIDPTLNQEELVIRSDGRTSFSLIGQVMCAGKTVEDLQQELNERYTRFVRNPSIVVQVRQGDTPLQDIVDSVDARQGQGGQARQTSVSPDGTIQLPVIGSIPAVGLTLKEIAREVNARYRLRLGGIEVTPILLNVAPRFVYVVGEVAQPGRFELTGPTSVMQAVALAQGFNPGGNVRQVIIFRRDQNWQLTATKLDLGGALLGKRPQPSDEIWLRDSDIVLIPKKPIQRLSEAVNLYLSNTLYSIFPQQGVAFNFDNFTPL